MADHPLDPLSADEFHEHDDPRVRPCCREVVPRRVRRAAGTGQGLRRGSHEDDEIPRSALTVLWNRADNKAYQGVVDLQPGDDVLVP